MGWRQNWLRGLQKTEQLLIETNTSKFGYTIYKVKYLAKPPLPDHPEDWVPSQYLMAICRKGQAKAFYERHAEKIKGMTDEKTIIANQSEEFLFSVLRDMCIDIDKRGLLIPFLFGKKNRS